MSLEAPCNACASATFCSSVSWSFTTSVARTTTTRDDDDDDDAAGMPSCCCRHRSAYTRIMAVFLRTVCSSLHALT
jgi:hypothetical protein